MLQNTVEDLQMIFSTILYMLDAQTWTWSNLLLQSKIYYFNEEINIGLPSLLFVILYLEYSCKKGSILVIELDNANFVSLI